MADSPPLYDQDYHSILLWMPNWIGDVILTLPSVQSLRRAYPKARITAVVKPPSDELLLGHPAINTVHPLPSGPDSGFWKDVKFARSLKKYKFDLGIVLPNSFGAAFLLSLTGAKNRLGYNTDARDILLTHPIVTTNRLKKSQYRVEYYFKIFSPLKMDVPDTVFSPVIKQEGDLSVREALLNIGLDEDEEFIVLHPGTSKVERSWHVERFGILCQKIIKFDGKKLVLIGTKSEEAIIKRIKDYCPPGKVKVSTPINLRVLAGILKKSRIFIGNDSGMMHLAAMVGTPIVSIFGPGNPSTTGPYMDSEYYEILSQGYSCSPCRQRFFKECKPSPHNKPYCLEDITVKNVHDAIERLLKRV